jgi:hypothetical protein
VATVPTKDKYAKPGASLRKEADAHKDWSAERKDQYVYGKLREMGWKPPREKKS